MKKYLRILLMCLHMTPSFIIHAGTMPVVDKPSLPSPLEIMDIASLPEAPKEISSTYQSIIFTNYYTGDFTNSSNITSAGLTTRSFQINEKGWYTYKGMVVVAAATTLCLQVKSGGCGKYNSVPKGLILFNLREEILISVEGEEYKAIVLDSCGACMYFHSSDQGLQRFDIFIASSKYAFGKTEGKLITTE